MEPHKDIAKMGYLKRLKTMKKKWFVLWNEGATGPARLEYYDSEKKFRNAVPAKRGININNCFNINKKSDTKHKFAIALYTKEDCFAVVCENEEEQQAWLTALLQLLSYNSEGSESSRTLFEHIWQVTVKQRGLASSWNIGHGSYRLCLTNSALSLIRLHEEEPAVTFQLASIRRCGHSDCFFFMEVGRWAMTGAGELWMQVEDTVIAHNMHDVILSSMRASNASTENQMPVIRTRSRSSASEITRPGSSRNQAGYESATLPKRSKTISEPHGQSPMRNRKSGQNRSANRHTVAMLSRHSPAGAPSPLSQSLMEQGDMDPRDRTDSMESRGSHCTASSSISVDEIDEQLPSGSASTRSVTPDGPFPETDYLAMSPISKESSTSPSYEAVVSPYMDMSPGMLVETSSEDTSSYIDMSPGQIIDTRTSFSASSPAPSSASSISNHEEEKSRYLDMTPIARSLPTVQEKSAYMDQYMAVSPGNQSPRNTSYLRPDKVYSYLSEENQAEEGLPKRAYSVGSKPAAVVRINAKVAAESPGAPIESSSKSLSAPHLPENGKNDKGKKEGDGHFMEMDFFRQRTDSSSSFRSRTSSGGKDIKDFRSRTSSLGQQDFRPRTSSAGNLNRPTNNSFKLDKPWLSKDKTSQLNQDSIRPRTSSCGQDYRPRAGSLGNSKHRKPGKTGSQESLTKVLFNSIRRKSQELSKGHSKSGYMDMTSPGSRPSYTEESGYMDMAPQTIEEHSPAKSISLNEGYLGVPDHTSTPKGKETDPYMEMRMCKKEGAPYANVNYHSDSNRSKSHTATSSLVEEEEMEITPPEQEIKDNKNAESSVTEMDTSQVDSQPQGGNTSSVKLDSDGYLSIDFSGAQKSSGLNSVSGQKNTPSATSPNPRPQKVEGYFSEASEKMVTSLKGKSPEKSPTKTSGEEPLYVPVKSIPLPVPFQTGSSVIKPITVKSPPAIQTGRQCPRKPNEEAGYMSMSFDEKSDGSKEDKIKSKAVSPDNKPQSPLTPDSLRKRHGGRTSPQPAAAKNPKTTSSVQKVRRSSSNKEPTQTRTVSNRLVVSNQDKEPSLRKTSSSSLPGNVEGNRRTSSSGSDPDSAGVKRQSLQENTVFSEAGPSMSRNSSKTSLSGEKELVYAALDLSDPSEDSGQSNPPQKSVSRTSLSAMADEEGPPLSYAQIDFTKSGGLKHSASEKEMRNLPR